MLKSKELNLIIRHLKNPKKLYWGIFAALIGAGISAFVPYLYGRLVDIVVLPETQIRLVIGILLLWLTISVTGDLLNRFSNRRSYEVATDLTNNLLIDAFHHLLNLPMKFHKAKKIGKVIRQIDRGIDQLFNLIDSTIFSFLPTIFSFFVVLVILFLVEWRLSLILMMVSVIYILITLFYTKVIVKKQKMMHQAWEKSYGDLFDSVHNVQNIKANTNEEWERKRHRKNFNRAGRIFKDWRLIWQKMSTWQRIVFSVGFVVIFGCGLFMLRAGQLTPGKLIMFVGYVSMLTAPLASLAEQYRSIRSGITGFRRSAKIYSIAPEKDFRYAIKPEELKGQVVFNKVNFGYKKDKLILKDVSFEVQPGETVAIVGKSGVGKTTLVDLISRYILPSKGQIMIDDIDIKKIKLSYLRENIALVSQEVMLFNDTIKNNIRYGRSDATDEEIIEICQAANAAEFIEKFPQKYDQAVGERGIKLSTGQKQRVAIARALIRNPKILILDEATSALDSVSEKLVQEALKKLVQGRTTFIIAHRLSTIQHADKIIVLEKGRIVEMGSHAELIDNPHGVYRNFWELQSAIQKAN